MNISAYLCIKKIGTYGSRASLRVTKSMPDTAYNEIALKLNIELPDAIFTKPTLSANVVVPKEAVSKPVIEAQVIDNVQEIIKQQTGFDVRLEVVEPEKTERGD